MKWYPDPVPILITPQGPILVVSTMTNTTLKSLTMKIIEIPQSLEYCNLAHKAISSISKAKAEAKALQNTLQPHSIKPDNDNDLDHINLKHTLYKTQSFKNFKILLIL